MSTDDSRAEAEEENTAGMSPLDAATSVLDRLPGRRVASLYDLAVQYATLDWYQTVTSGAVSFDLDPEYLPLLTPDAKGDLYDEPENALVVNVDATGEEPRLTTGNGEPDPIEFRTVGRSQRYELGHAYPTNKTSSMTDYSLTTHKSASEHHLAGERDDAWGTANVVDRFTRWAHSEAADDVLTDFDGDTSVLEALRALGDDEPRLREVATAEESPLDPDDEETDHEVFVTVRIETPESDGYRYPGYFPVLNEVMAVQKRERLESLNIDSAGDGVGYVTGDTGRVTGASSGLLGMYTKQQREHFPGVPKDGATAWRARPVALSTATALATANSVFESFFTPLGEGRRLYVLPYLSELPTDLDPETVVTFVDDVFGRFRSSDDVEGVVDGLFAQRAVAESNTDEASDESRAALGLDDDQWSLYDQLGVATVLLVSGNPDRVYFEHLQTDVYRPRAFEQARGAVVRELRSASTFSRRVSQLQSGGFRLLDPEIRTAPVVFGSDFERTTAPTRSSHEVDGTPKAGDIDDVVTRLLDAFLGGDAVPRAALLEGYVHELVQTQREQFGSDDGFEVPDARLLEQYVQFRALEAIGAVTAGTDGGREAANSTWLTTPRDESSSADGSPTSDESSTTTTATRPTPSTGDTPVTQTESATETDGAHDDRDALLASFLADHAVLDDSDPHRATFLLGGLVGRISALQRRNDISSTLTRRYPIDWSRCKAV